MMQHNLVALQQLVGRVMKEFLPGGDINLQQGDKTYRGGGGGGGNRNLRQNITSYLNVCLATLGFYLIKDQTQAQLLMRRR